MRSKVVLVSMAALLALVSGCGIVNNLSAAVPVAPSIAFRVISPTQDHSAYFYEVPAQNAVFRTQSDVDSFLSEISKSRAERLGMANSETLPKIDFSTEQGILVLFGAQAHGGYGGKIAAVEELPDRLVVHPVRELPNNQGIYAQMVIYPYHYIAIPRTEKPIDFASTVDRTTPGPWWAIF